MCWSLSTALAPPAPPRPPHSYPWDGGPQGDVGVPKGMWGSQVPTASSHPGPWATTPNLCSHTSPWASSLPVPWGGFIIFTWCGLDVPWEQHCLGGCVCTCVCISLHVCQHPLRVHPACVCVQAVPMCTVCVRWGGCPARVCTHMCSARVCSVPCGPCRVLGAHAAPAGPPARLSPRERAWRGGRGVRVANAAPQEGSRGPRAACVTPTTRLPRSCCHGNKGARSIPGSATPLPCAPGGAGDRAVPGGWTCPGRPLRHRALFSCIERVPVPPSSSGVTFPPHSPRPRTPPQAAGQLPWQRPIPGQAARGTQWPCPRNVAAVSLCPRKAAAPHPPSPPPPLLPQRRRLGGCGWPDVGPDPASAAGGPWGGWIRPRTGRSPGARGSLPPSRVAAPRDNGSHALVNPRMWPWPHWPGWVLVAETEPCREGQVLGSLLALPKIGNGPHVGMHPVPCPCTPGQGQEVARPHGHYGCGEGGLGVLLPSPSSPSGLAHAGMSPHRLLQQQDQSTTTAQLSWWHQQLL